MKNTKKNWGEINEEANILSKNNSWVDKILILKKEKEKEKSLSQHIKDVNPMEDSQYG